MKKTILLLALAGGSLLVQKLAAVHPALLTPYTALAYPKLMALLALTFGKLPFPALPALLLFLFLLPFLALFRALRSHPNRRRAFSSTVHALFQGGALTLFFFEILFGWQYARKPLASELNLPPLQHPTPALEATLDKVLGLLFSLPNPPPSLLQPLSQTEPLLPPVEKAIAQELQGLLHSHHLPISSPAPLRFYPFGSLAMRFGGAGLYSPLTGEIYLPKERLLLEFPFLFAHELAHRQGFARESEADFLATLTTLSSPSPLIRTSGAIALYLSLQSQACQISENLCRRGERIPSWLRQDLRAMAENRAAYESPKLSHMAEKTNDLYLKSQGVAQGIQSYDLSLNLLLRYLEKEKGGLLSPLASPLPKD